MLYKGECHSDSLAMQAGTGGPSAGASVRQELTITAVRNAESGAASRQI